MSYLVNTGGAIPKFSQALISFWVRVPQFSVDACFGSADADPPVPFDGIIPLIVMGVPGFNSGINLSSYQTLSAEFTSTGPSSSGSVVETLTSEQTGLTSRHFTLSITTVPIPTAGGAVDKAYTTAYSVNKAPEAPTLEPTYIGIDCRFIHAENDPGLRLRVHLESNQSGSGSNATFVLTSYTPAIGSGSACGFFGYTGSASSQWDQIGTLNYQNQVQSGHLTPIYGACTTKTTQEGGPNYTDHSSESLSSTNSVTSNTDFPSDGEWHHVLISIDFNTISVTGGDAPSIDSAAHIYIAIDDTNYTGFDIDAETDGSNDFISDVAGDARAAGVNVAARGGTPTYSSGELSVPAGDAPIGIPATDDYATRILEVDMAELQIWTGQFSDTSNISIRRLFIDDDGKPVPPSKAAKELGQPDILLHRSPNWIKGENRGKTGYSPDSDPPQLLQAGQFTPTGEIDKFIPDPALGQ